MRLRVLERGETAGVTHAQKNETKETQRQREAMLRCVARDRHTAARPRPKLKHLPLSISAALPGNSTTTQPQRAPRLILTSSTPTSALDAA
jgi:hypothetical protein